MSHVSRRELLLLGGAALAGVAATELEANAKILPAEHLTVNAAEQAGGKSQTSGSADGGEISLTRGSREESKGRTI